MSSDQVRADLQLVQVVYAQSPSDYVTRFDFSIQLVDLRSGISQSGSSSLELGSYSSSSGYIPASSWSRDSINSLIKSSVEYSQLYDQLLIKLRRIVSLA